MNKIFIIKLTNICIWVSTKENIFIFLKGATKFYLNFWEYFSKNFNNKCYSSSLVNIQHNMQIFSLHIKNLSDNSERFINTVMTKTLRANFDLNM